MKQVYGMLAAALTALAAAVVSVTPVHAHAQPRTFVVVLSAAEEVPTCTSAGREARGVAVFRVLDETTGLIQYRLIANNLPGAPTAAHIHLAPAGEPGPVVQPLPLTAGAENGVIGEGTFTNPQLLGALQSNPQSYYVNVHTGVCPKGVIRGQFGEQGP